MAPRSTSFKQMRRRMRRSLGYSNRRIDSLSLPLSGMVLDYFHCFSPFDYLDADFATRLSRDGSVDPYTLLVAMVYMDRMRVCEKQLFESSDPADLYLSALVVASKFINDNGVDEYIHNDEWAASAATSLKRVNELELQLLNALKWDLLVSSDEFEACLRKAETSVARQMWRRTGIATYAQLSVLNDSREMAHTALLPLLSTLAVAAAVYGALVLTLSALPTVLSSLALLQHHRPSTSLLLPRSSPVHVTGTTNVVRLPPMPHLNENDTLLELRTVKIATIETCRRDAVGSVMMRERKQWTPGANRSLEIGVGG